MLIDRARVDKTFRRLCGWSRIGAIPSEATFSRAFAEFSASELPSRLHAALIVRTHKDRLVGHVARDSTAIESREKPFRPEKPAAQAAAGSPQETVAEGPPSKRKPGRPRKDGKPSLPKQPAQPSRIERQKKMSLAEMQADLPRYCDFGFKTNAKGYQTKWIGYKLHMDTVDGDIPVSCILTAASVHDSQVAIPLATMTAHRVTNLYDLMDSAYDVAEILDHSRALGHVPIVDVNPRNNPKLKQEKAQEAKRRERLGFCTAESIRYKQRTSAERVNGNLKDNHGGNYLRVRGHAKVMCHLMFGILVITTEQMLRLAT
jgi:hypothetical protein